MTTEPNTVDLLDDSLTSETADLEVGGDRASGPAPYAPGAVFSVEEGDGRNVPRVLIAPARYIQGEGVLEHLGRYLSVVPSTRPALLISAGGRRRDGAGIVRGLRAADLDPVEVTFGGECSEEEVERMADALRAETPPVDCVVAVGGGKCVDAGKCVATRLGVPVVICPTVASNDAPCSALSVMYAPEGAFAGVEFFPQSPAVVAVDTRVVAEAPLRYLVAGMGDAMATWYEARTCYENPDARSAVGARPTRTALALGELCAGILFADGLAAAEAVWRGEVTDALEDVVEANTLLSGIGFESGGVAAAHSVAQGFTLVPAVHANYLHGEMVAFGLLTQLVLEERHDEARKVAEFFARVGLPVHLGHLGLDPSDPGSSPGQAGEALGAVVGMAMMLFVGNEPFEVTAEMLLKAMHDAHALGRHISEQEGDAAYGTLHAA